MTGCAQRKIIFLDTFSTDQFSAGYRWFDEENPDSHNLTDEPGWLRIIAGPRQDLWHEFGKRGAPLMLRPAPANDFAADSFVSASPLANPSQPINTQIGLFVFKEDKQDGNHDFLFFGLTRQDINTPFTQNGLFVTKTTGGASSMVAGHTMAEDAVFLRIERVGNQWKFYWKLLNDDTWNLLTTINNLPLSSFEVGMGVKTFDLDPPSAINSCQGNFDFFLLWRKDKD